MNIDLGKAIIQRFKILDSKLNKNGLARCCGKTGMSNFMNTADIFEIHYGKHDET